MTETMTAETGAAAAYRAPGAAVVRVMVAVTRCALTVHTVQISSLMPVAGVARCTD